MIQIILPILGIAILAALALWKKPQKIIVADAGPTQKMTSKEQKKKSFYISYQSGKIGNGRVVNTRDYIRVLVDGKCMEPRGILDKSQILVKRIDKNSDFNRQVKENDVLLIHLHDKKVYRLRILRNGDNPDELITYRYLDDGSEHISSRNHSYKDVVGVVKYLIN